MTNSEAYFHFLKKYNKSEYVFELVVRIIFSYVNKYETMNDFYVHLNENCDNFEIIDEYLKKIDEGYPYQYLINQGTFNGHDYFVDERVLIPRMETEELLKEISSYLKNKESLTIGDIGTGSGCLAIEIKKASPRSVVYGSDISLSALEVAKFNSEKLKEEVEFLHGDLLNPFLQKNIKLDVLVSNPPYVKNREEVEKSVQKFEPSLALYAENGIDFYERILKDYRKVMNNHGAIFFEFNYDQKKELEVLIDKYIGECHYKFYQDIFGKWRYVKIIF